jgi:transposase
VQKREAGDLDAWLASAEAYGIAELSGFSAGISRDHAAVMPSLDKSWSNGQVEGQIHPLKLLKRQMCGRSGFLLLGRRVLPFHPFVETQRFRSAQEIIIKIAEEPLR